MFLALFAGILFGQFDTASVVGTVHDQAGGVVANSKATLENIDTGVTKVTNTDQNGNFTFFDVRPGQYRLKAESTGFKTAVAEQFTVTVGARQRVDLKLEVGSVTESVEVSGAASAVETDTSSRGQVIAGQAIVNLPLNGRSYSDLALLVPGVRKSTLQNDSASSRDASYNVNGQRSALNNFMVDGVDNNAYGTSNQGFSNQVVQLTPDTVAEFRVETNNYSAEYGRAAGAVINATTKSGTNKLHGAAWEYLRNTDLNAVGFFKPQYGVKPTLVQNQFGAAIGGAVKKDKLFYFFDYEGFRRVSTSLTLATVPTADQKSGNLGTAVRNPLTGTAYPNGVVPASDMSAFAKAVLNELPGPNRFGANGLPLTTDNFESLPRTTFNSDKGDSRIDYYWRDNITTYFRYSQREANQFIPGNIPGLAGGNNNGNVHMFNQQINPGLTWTLSPTSTLEARLGVTWFDGGKSPIGVGDTSLIEKYNIKGLPDDPRVKGALNSQRVTGFSDFGRQTSNPQFQNPFVMDPKVNYSKILGRHTMKLGLEYQRIDTAIMDFSPVYGADNYGEQFSRPSGVSKVSGSSESANKLIQAYNMADFLFGARSQYQLTNFHIVDYRQRMYFAYLQDDFKASSKLTLNLGLRYEFATPQWEKNNQLSNFDPATGTLIQAKDGSIGDRALVNPNYNNWGPRVGFAYQVKPGTVLRGGYGISYIQFNRLGGENLLAYNGPWVVGSTITQDITKTAVCTSDTQDPSTCFRPMQMGYPFDLTSPEKFKSASATARYIPRDNPTGYVQSWHFSVQRELKKDLVLDVGYVGNKGTHLMILGDVNQAPANATGGKLTVTQRRPYKSFGDVEIAYGAGYSTYNALQAKLEKRYASGLYLMNAFTWSKAIDSAPGHLETGAGSASRANLMNLRSEKGISDYDQPFNDTISAVYALPFGKGKKWGSGWNRLVDGVLGGWQMTGITTITSGLPVTITYSPTSEYVVSNVGLSYRANYAGGSLVTPEGSARSQTGYIQYLNKAAVVAPTDVTQPFGNLSRNPVRGYGFFQMDLGMHKDFDLWNEATKLQFRCETFNLSNQTNFQAPSAGISSSSYGRITSTFPARQVQFAARLSF